jgi:hypothetical protein
MLWKDRRESGLEIGQFALDTFQRLRLGKSGTLGLVARGNTERMPQQRYEIFYNDHKQNLKNSIVVYRLCMYYFDNYNLNLTSYFEIR